MNGSASIAFTPQAPGSYCFRAEFRPSATAPFSPAKHTDLTTECFTATGPAPGPGTLTVSGATTFGPGPVLGTFGSAGSAVHLITQGSSTVTGGISLRGGSELEYQGTLTLGDSTGVLEGLS